MVQHSERINESPDVTPKIGWWEKLRRIVEAIETSEAEILERRLNAMAGEIMRLRADVDELKAQLSAGTDGR